MGKEVENWWKQAQRDLISANNSLNAKDFYLSAFMSQQAVEKALKAVLIKEKKELFKTHNISKIAKLLNLPDNLLIKIATLEPVYQETRYPDVSSKIPAEEFEEKDAIEFLSIAEEVIEWLKKKIN
ncbi:HEPN domain-containing protein [Candidatus Woesearchaeota archaeon]|nr:HEPN domain-containing protein [Candidatus Woesearchaeota archaeon]